MKENILVVFGGKSAEHDISIITGLQAISNVDREKYNVIPLYISKENEFFVGEKLCYLSTYMPFLKSKKGIFKASLIAGDSYLYSVKKSAKIYYKGEKGEEIIEKSTKNAKKTKKTRKKFKKLVKIDCAVLCCHGKSGEDGSLQGLLNLAGIPYTSSNLTSSSLCLDKIFMKDVIKSNGYDTADYLSFDKTEYILEPEMVFSKIESLGYPVFLKPANLGSSIGISKCKNREELEVGIEVAIKYDRRILVEKSIENNIEVNCAVFGNGAYVLPSNVEFPKTSNSFLTFDEKYIQRKEAVGSAKKVKSKISKQQEEKVKELAMALFKTFDCKGVVRIDFLIDKEDNKIYVNELNSIPGSLAFYLFKDKFDFKTLLNRMIDNAKKAQKEEEKMDLNFTSSALNNFNNSIKMNK